MKQSYYVVHNQCSFSSLFLFIYIYIFVFNLSIFSFTLYICSCYLTGDDFDISTRTDSQPLIIIISFIDDYLICALALVVYI